MRSLVAEDLARVRRIRDRAKSELETPWDFPSGSVGNRRVDHRLAKLDGSVALDVLALDAVLDCCEDFAKLLLDAKTVLDTARSRIEELEGNTRHLQLACNVSAADLITIGKMCGMTDDEYPLRAVERVVAERDSIRQDSIERENALARITDGGAINVSKLFADLRAAQRKLEDLKREIGA